MEHFSLNAKFTYAQMCDAELKTLHAIFSF